MRFKKKKTLLQCVGMVYLCRRGECYSTVTGVQGYSRWWPHPAARSLSGRRRSASLLPGKRPFQSSAHWWRQRQGSCMARTFQLRGRTISCVTKTLLCTFFNTHKNTYKSNRHINRDVKVEIDFLFGTSWKSGLGPQ